jgi:long-chain acyl-CoA synthetase
MVIADRHPVSDRATLTARLTAPGAEFELVERLVRGIPMQVYSGGPQTLRDVLLASGAFGDRDYLVYGTERWTYAQHLRQVAGLARRLLDHGLRKGDRIAVTMRNYPEWSAICYAAWTTGLVVVPLSAWWTAAELHYALTDSGARFVFADAERTKLIAPTLGGIPLVEVRGTDSPAPGVLRWADLAALDDDTLMPDADITPDDDATILYTSGTTGRPKGAIGTHRNHCTNVRNMAFAATVGAANANGGEPPAPDPDAPQPGTLCTFPLFHIAGITAICYVMMAGAKLVTQYKWDSDDALDLVGRERLTGVSGVPTVIRQLIDAAVSPAGRLVGGEPVAGEAGPTQSRHLTRSQVTELPCHRDRGRYGEPVGYLAAVDVLRRA